jgi:hypothetical protein
MKLLQELSEEVQIISEEKEGKGKNLYIEGVFLQCIPNRNGRIYPEHVMHKEVNRYLKEKVEKGQATGELGHPPNPSINLPLVSHKITKLHIEGKNVYGKALILDTDMGRNAKGLIEGGVKLGVSSRGLGTLKEIKEGLKEVQDDFRLVTAADIVADPSAPDAWVDGLMEGVDWIFNDKIGEWEKRIAYVEEQKKHVKKLSSKQLEETKLRLFENYISFISSLK